MRVEIRAVGRLRKGPEHSLCADYLDRFARTGRGLGLGAPQLREVEDRKAGGAEGEGALLLRGLPQEAKLCVLDERGATMTSPDFAATLAAWRDEGVGVAVFMIGGADGVSEAVTRRADLCLSFGPMVWPHMLARVMLSEQLYRASAILAGTPYHRV